MSDESAFGFSPFIPAPTIALPPGMLIWASMYTAMLYACGGMIAYHLMRKP